MEIRITVPILKNTRRALLDAPKFESFHDPVEINDAFRVHFSKSGLATLLHSMRYKPNASWAWHRLCREAEDLTRTHAVSRLLCLTHLSTHWERVGVVPYSHQLATAHRVIEEMRGRAILADEVGLGKTIEAGMILKEYMLRGLVRRTLILTPASLSRQWFYEMREKFRIPVVMQRSQYDWLRHECIVASIDTAKRQPHAAEILSQDWDMLIVDEAHRLKNSRTQNWQFINSISKKYFLMLTATPVQNDLKELYNLITLLKPGQLGTYRDFKQRFVQDKRTPKDSKQLQNLLSQVMIRNRRGKGTIEFTKRIVHPVAVTLTEQEQQFYRMLHNFVRTKMQTSLALKRTILPYITLLREACSSSWAAALTLKKLAEKAGPDSKDLLSLLEMAVNIEISAKIECLLKILGEYGHEKVIVFTEYRGTQAFIKRHLEEAGLATVNFDGSLSAGRKEFTKFLFSRYGDVMISTEAGAEGLNLQYCNKVVNFDLPWNPMRLEQRIGRVHRLGQTQDVLVFNLATAGTIEEHILKLLHEKINMFEMVVGELDAILSQFGASGSLESRVIDILTKADSEEELRHEFDELGDDILKARQLPSEVGIFELYP
ncbi:MAG: DEAD/DEAH box helicase family protein [Firmicutes bacterium]|nr:DEAD/DEAH box helicase family protein [Bacillota bacterium]